MDHMQQMMSGMFIGMMIGLIGGLILGSQYKGDLFLSTIWGMFLGSASGFIIGLPLSMLSVLEGILAGVMGGMMGAMLGEMLPSERFLIMLFILIMVYTGCMLMIMKIVAKEETEHKRKWWQFDFHHPATPAVLLIVVFIWFQSFSNDSSSQISPSNHFTNEAHEIRFTAIEYAYQPNKVKLTKNTPIKVTFNNTGKVEHDIEVISNGNIEIISNSSNEHHHGVNTEEKIHLHAKPGESVESVWKVLKEGTYEFYCTIPGHKESGMIGELIVM